MKTILLISVALTVAIFSSKTYCPAQAAVAPVTGELSSSAFTSGADNPPRATPAPRVMTGAANSQKTNRKANAKESPAPLLVQFAQSDGEVLDELTEDLTIMARVLERSLEREAKADGPVVKMGVPLLINSGAPSVRAMHLDGFGALFMIKVNFPLIGPAAVDEKKPDQKAGSEWDSAKRDVAETEPIDKWSAAENDSSGSEFDPARVGMLKTVILRNLKNAMHIRHLEPDEFIAVTVFGTPAVETPALIEGRSASKAARAAAQDLARLKETRAQHARSRKGTAMTIRVKKSEADAFANQQLTSEEFQRRATINSYFASGYATTSLNSWAITGSGSNRATGDARRDSEP